MPNVRGKAGDTQWTFVFVPPQVVDHTAHVPRLLRVQDPQHRLRGPHQREPLHRHQRQRGHLRAGALHRQREFCRESSCAGLSISGSGGQCLNHDPPPRVCGFTPPTTLSCIRFSLPRLPFPYSSLIKPFRFLRQVLLYSFLPTCRFSDLFSPSVFAFHFRCRLWLAPFLPEALTSISRCCMLFSLNSVPLALKVPWNSSLAFSLAWCRAPSP